MSRPLTLSDLLQTLEAALLALEDDLLHVPQPRMVALVARRRRSVLVLRRHVGEARRMQLRLPHQNFKEFVATEFRLARMVDVLLPEAPEGSALYQDLLDLRAEVDEAALSLRLIEQLRVSGRVQG